MKKRSGFAWTKPETRERLVGYKSETTILSDGNRAVTMITEIKENPVALYTTTTYRVEFRGEMREPVVTLTLDSALDLVYDSDFVHD